MNKWERILLNAVVVALIAFISTLGVRYPPDAANVWAALIAFGLSLLSVIRAALERNNEKKNKKPSIGPGTYDPPNVMYRRLKPREPKFGMLLW